MALGLFSLPWGCLVKYAVVVMFISVLSSGYLFQQTFSPSQSIATMSRSHSRLVYLKQSLLSVCFYFRLFMCQLHLFTWLTFSASYRGRQRVDQLQSLKIMNALSHSSSKLVAAVIHNQAVVKSMYESELIRSSVVNNKHHNCYIALTFIYYLFTLSLQ